MSPPVWPHTLGEKKEKPARGFTRKEKRKKTAFPFEEKKRTHNKETAGREFVRKKKRKASTSLEREKERKTLPGENKGGGNRTISRNNAAGSLGASLKGGRKAAKIVKGGERKTKVVRISGRTKIRTFLRAKARAL